MGDPSLMADEERYQQVLERYAPETLGALFEEEFRALTGKQ